jgi:hypothetical protein
MLFTASTNNTFEPIGCDTATFEYTPMSKVHVQWTYKKGDKIIQMGFMGIEKFRNVIINFMKEREYEKLTAPLFQEFIEEAFQLDDDDPMIKQRDPQKLFNTYLDSKGQGYLTVEDIQKIPQEDLKIVGLNCEQAHGPVAGQPGDYGMAAQGRQVKKEEDQDDSKVDKEPESKEEEDEKEDEEEEEETEREKDEL